MFPGYAFAYFDAAKGRHGASRDRWQPIARLPGVVRVLGSYDAPTPLPRGMVEWLIFATPEGGVRVEELRAMPQFKVGDRVRVLDGPFASFPAIVENVPARDRLQVLVGIFGRSTPVELSPRDVELV